MYSSSLKQTSKLPNILSCKKLEKCENNKVKKKTKKRSKRKKKKTKENKVTKIFNYEETYQKIKTEYIKELREEKMQEQRKEEILRLNTELPKEFEIFLAIENDFKKLQIAKEKETQWENFMQCKNEPNMENEKDFNLLMLILGKSRGLSC